MLGRLCPWDQHCLQRYLIREPVTVMEDHMLSSISADLTQQVVGTKHPPRSRSRVSLSSLCFLDSAPGTVEILPMCLLSRIVLIGNHWVTISGSLISLPEPHTAQSIASCRMPYIYTGRDTLNAIILLLY